MSSSLESGLVSSSNSSDSDWANRHPNWSAAAVLIFVLHLCFFPFIWGDKTLLSSARDMASVLPRGAWAGEIRALKYHRTLDAAEPAWHSEPLAAVVGNQYRNEKNWPLWNPYQAYGAPLAADMQSQPFNPLFALFSLHPTPWTYNIFVLTRLFIAGFFAYLYLRFFAGFTASIAGGIASMLSGYYMLYITMPHVSVEVLLPAVFFSIELLLRKPGRSSILTHAFVTLFVLFGGNPQSSLLALTFGYSYFLFRIVSDRLLRSSAVSLGLRFASAEAMGFGMAAMLLLPFAEFMRLSFDTHQSQNLGWVRGLAHDPLGNLSLATYLTPLFLGPPWADITHGFSGGTGVRGFWGVVPFFLAIIACLATPGKRNRQSGFGRRAITGFFAVAVLLLMMKRYGVPLVNWVGGLPFFNLVDFALYDEPLMGFSIAVLAALGVEALLEEKTPLASVLSTAAFIVGSLGLTFTLIRPQIQRPEVDHFLYFYGSIGLGVLLMSLFGALFLGLRWWGSRIPRVTVCAGGILILLIADLSLNFILPLNYFLDTPSRASANPYVGAPMVDFLKTKIGTSQWRVFARNGILFPDWAGVFGLSDIRDLDDMYYVRYLPFVKAFIPKKESDDELFDRFNGLGEYAFATSGQLRLLQLSSVKYVLTNNPYLPLRGLIDEIVAANGGHLTPGRETHVRGAYFTINGEPKAVLFEHAPYERLPYKFTVAPGKDRLSFSIGQDPEIYREGKTVSDGVEFRLEVKDQQGTISTVYDRFIDPTSNLKDRAWIPAFIDLQKFTGQNIELLFTTLPGPIGDARGDFAGWGEISFGNESTASTFDRVYDKEAKIYQYDNVLPRAAVFHRVEVVPDAAAALTRLQDQSLDVLHTAIVEAGDLDSARQETVAEINHAAPSQNAASAQITSYSSQKVTIDASLQAPGLLQLNDTNYPGWKVFVDGKSGKWLRTDYLFRGVFLSAGQHSVEYRYEPESFRYGLWISGGFLLFTIVFWCFPIKKIHDRRV